MSTIVLEVELSKVNRSSNDQVQYALRHGPTEHRRLRGKTRTSVLTNELTLMNDSELASTNGSKLILLILGKLFEKGLDFGVQ